MARMIYVQPAHPKGQFYQDVLDEQSGDIVAEHCRSETIDGKQVPVPVQMTDTPALRRALLEVQPGSQPPAPAAIREAQKDEIEASLKRRTAPAAETPGPSPDSLQAVGAKPKSSTS